MATAPVSINRRLRESPMPKPVRQEGASLEMRVGERVHIELLTTGERLWGELVGDKQGRFLLVWLPQFKKYRKSLVSESMVAVRALNRDYQLCGFRTTIAQLLTSPMPMAFLDYPTSYEKLSLRQHERVDCLFPALLLFNGEEYKTMVTNISTGGAGVVISCADKHPEHIEENAELFLMFKSLNGGQEAVVRGELRNMRKVGEKIQLGLKFDNLIGDSHRIIEDYVHDVKRYNAVN